nr:iron chelate uptake ABC transporter family permease subunit [uncultured Moellerella sp.]
MKPTITGKVFRVGRYSWVVSPRNISVLLMLFLIIIAVSIISITIGKFAINFSDIIQAFFEQQSGSISEKIILDIRVPRLLTALAVGASLGISGAIFQSVSRNVLGSPDIIGFTTGAATGALLQIIVFNGGVIDIAISAILGGVFTAAAVYFLSLNSGSMTGYRMILIGIGVGSILSAFNGLLLVKGNIDNAMVANLWLAGSLNARTWQHVYPTYIGLIIIIPILLIQAKKLTLMEMGDDMARQLGVNIERTRLIMVFSAVILAALATGAAGPIAFVALAAPQLVSRMTHSRQLPIIGSALMGALLLILADVLTQVLPLKTIMPVGLMTGIIGGLYLVWLLTRSKNI